MRFMQFDTNIGKNIWILIRLSDQQKFEIREIFYSKNDENVTEGGKKPNDFPDYRTYFKCQNIGE